MGESERPVKTYRPQPEKAEERSKTGYRSNSRARRSKLRLLYFGLSSLWGFLVGIAILLCCIKQHGAPMTSGLRTYGLLFGAGAVAVIGGLLAAKVYKDAVKRSLR